jgi:hypothetical protein
MVTRVLEGRTKIRPQHANLLSASGFCDLAWSSQVRNGSSAFGIWASFLLGGSALKVDIKSKVGFWHIAAVGLAKRCLPLRQNAKCRLREIRRFAASRSACRIILSGTSRRPRTDRFARAISSRDAPRGYGETPRRGYPARLRKSRTAALNCPGCSSCGRWPHSSNMIVLDCGNFASRMRA